MQKPGWDDYRYFLAVARGGSLAAAAAALGVNPTTVYRRLRELERRVGVRLFDRVPAGYLPTRAGEDLCAAVERAEQELIGAELRLAGQDLRPSGPLRVTTTEDLAVYVLQRFIARFQQDYPEIVVELSTADVLSDMARREADVAIRATHKPPDFLVGRKLGPIPWGLFASTDYLDRRGRPRGPDELPGHRVILGAGSLASLAPSRWLEQRAGPGAAIQRSASLLALLQAVRHGLGLGVLPVFLARAHPELQPALDLGPLSGGDCWILTHPDLRHTLRVRTFMERLSLAIREAPACLG